MTMSLFTGPGRNSEMSMIRSSNVCGPNLPTSSRCPGDSIWNMPSVRVLRISSKVVGSSRGIGVDVDRSRRRPGPPRRWRARSPTACGCPAGRA